MSMPTHCLAIFGVALVISATGCQTHSPNTELIDLLVNIEADADARADAVDRLEPLTAEDRTRLLAAIDPRNLDRHPFTGNGDSGYIYRALIRDADTDTVHGLGELLIDSNKRYMAVALGIIGDPAAAQYLNTAIRSSTFSFVQNNGKKALRQLNVRNSLENLPRASRFTYPIKPTIKADTTTLRLGERVTITATYENTSEKTSAAIYTPWFNLFHAISLQGDHIERLPGPNIFYIVNEDYFETIGPGESYTVSQTFELVVQPILADKWWPAFEGKTFDMLCLKRIEDGSGWVLASYVQGQPTTLRIASVHRPENYRNFAEKFAIKDYLWADLISPAIELECIPEKPEAQD
ncbi:MAG: HEAT repeat domain-containing protein [Planctomycetota bacterium]